VLVRPALGLKVRLSGPWARVCSELLVARPAGLSLGQLRRTMAVLGRANAAQLLEFFLERQVLRPVREGNFQLEGTGPLANEATQLVRAGGWSLPPIHFRPRLEPAGAGVVIALSAGQLWAVRGDASPCPDCLRLRIGARAVKPGLPRAGRRAFLAEAFLELQKAPLAPRQALRVGAVGISRSSFLEHPDCERCSPTRSVAQIAAAMRRRTAAVEPGAREALRDGELSPLELDTVQGQKGRYPLDDPFTWGSVHLRREWKGHRFSSSTLGGIYSAGRRSVEIATSEGAERLAVRGARPDLWAVAADEPKAVPLRALYSHATAADEKALRPFCHALDLIDGAARLVPFESVVVGLPRKALPSALHFEPFYTGAASHRTLSEAVLHATLELLGRDAFMFAWYRRRALPRLDWPARPSARVAARARFLEQRGLKLELFQLTFDLPLPLVLLRLTASRRRGNWPQGGALLVPGAGFSPMAALDHALGLACGQFISIALESAPFKEPLNPKAVRDLGRRLAFWPLLARYLDSNNSGAHAFLSGAPKRFDDLPQAPATIPALRRLLREAGLSWLVVRLTDGPSRRAGFETTKVIIPGLLNLAVSRSQMDLGLSRLNQEASGTRKGLNPHPHPLY
jgi:thiazole/oxazole-forming peptide maturase SagD family component